MAKDKTARLRNLISGYSDSIRLSDIKALIAVLFVAIMMGTVLQFKLSAKCKRNCKMARVKIITGSQGMDGRVELQLNI